MPWWDPACADELAQHALCVPSSQLEEAMVHNGAPDCSTPSSTSEHAISPVDQVPHSYACAAATEHVLLSCQLLSSHEVSSGYVLQESVLWL